MKQSNRSQVANYSLISSKRIKSAKMEKKNKTLSLRQENNLT